VVEVQVVMDQQPKVELEDVVVYLHVELLIHQTVVVEGVLILLQLIQVILEDQVEVLQIQLVHQLQNVVVQEIHRQ
jgi:hypothetical protein